MILFKKYIEQLIDVGIHVTPFQKKLLFLNLFVHLELVLITQYTMTLNYV